MNRKKTLAFILSLATLTGLTACGGSSGSSSSTGSSSSSTASSSAANGEKTVLRMAWWGSQARHDATVKVIEAYEAQNTNIDIEYEFYDFDGYFTKLNTLVASNSVWDIFQLGGNFPTYIDKIVPLNDYISSGVIDTSDTTEAFLATTAWDGKQVGLSNGVNTYGIAYDPQLFKDAGVAEPTENWTWEDYKNACLTIHDKLGIYGSSQLDDFIAGCSMNVSQESFDLNFFAISNDKMGFEDSSLLTDYIQMRKDLVDAGAYPDPGAIAEIKDIEGDYLVTGDAAMTWVASNQMPTLATAAGREIKLATVPRKTADGPSGAAIQSSQMMSISADSKTPEEAAKFINYFANDLDANKILNGERGVPIMGKVRTELQSGADANKQTMYNFVDLVGTFKTGVINVISPAATPEIKDQYKLLLEQVIYGEKTAEAAAKEIYDFSAGKIAG